MADITALPRFRTRCFDCTSVCEFTCPGTQRALVVLRGVHRAIHKRDAPGAWEPRPPPRQQHNCKRDDLNRVLLTTRIGAGGSALPHRSWPIGSGRWRGWHGPFETWHPNATAPVAGARGWGYGRTLSYN